MHRYKFVKLDKFYRMTALPIQYPPYFWRKLKFYEKSRVIFSIVTSIVIFHLHCTLAQTNENLLLFLYYSIIFFT